MNRRMSIRSWLPSLAFVLLLIVVLTGCKNNGSIANSDTGTNNLISTSGIDVSTDTSLDTWEEPQETDWDVTQMGLVPFNDNQILEYHVTMDEAKLLYMQEYGEDELYQEVSLQVTGNGVKQVFPKIGLRYKGDYSLHHCWDDNNGIRSYEAECAKLPMKIKFNKYYKHARFDGLKKINLHAMSEDASKMRERLSYQMYNEFGVDAPRTAYAKFRVNDHPPFLVLAVEQIDGRYTAHHYHPAGDGDLYKDVWPRSELNQSVARQGLKTNDDSDDNPNIDHMLAFGQAVSETTPETFVKIVSPYVDITQLLRYMAVDRAIKNWDGITAFYWKYRPHNFYWYFDALGTEKFVLVPWDMDKTFYAHDPLMDLEINDVNKPLPNWNVLPAICEDIPTRSDGSWVLAWDMYMVNSPGCDLLINGLAATGWDEFAQLGEELLSGSFQYSVVNEKVTLWHDQIQSLVDADPYIELSDWESSVEELRNILQAYIKDFTAHLQEGYIAAQ